MEIVALYIETDAYEEWGQLGTGNWIALWYEGRHLAFLDDDAPCWELPREGPDAPPLNTAVGIRTVPGAGDFTVMYDILAAKGIPYGVSPYASLDYCVNALQRGGRIRVDHQRSLVSLEGLIS